MLFSIKPALIALGLCASAVVADELIDGLHLISNETIQPLVNNIYTADPAAHEFNGRLYVYPSHDWNTSAENGNIGGKYDMKDYHVLSAPGPLGPWKDNGVAIKIEDVSWASVQMWAPDCVYRNGKYYLFFPARDHDLWERIGVAVGDTPIGPFKPDPSFFPDVKGIDPAVFFDDDGTAYMYTSDTYKPYVGILSPDLHNVTTKMMPVVLVNETGPVDDNNRLRFTEAPWMHKYKGKYYYSYSTGNSRLLAYAIGDSPLGPFKVAGPILEPVVGQTTHGSIIQFHGHWYLFFHDASCYNPAPRFSPNGNDYLRCAKVREIWYDENDRITLTPPKQRPTQGPGQRPGQGPAQGPTQHPKHPPM